jgi:hypothetical protein
MKKTIRLGSCADITINIFNLGIFVDIGWFPKSSFAILKFTLFEHFNDEMLIIFGLQIAFLEFSFGIFQ